MKLIDLTGQKFGVLEVLYKAAANRTGSTQWYCRCECGAEKVISSDHLTRKKHSVKSCGCKKTKKGIENQAWRGCGDISGDWWYSHIERERKQNTRARIKIEITKEYAWELFLKQDKKCALSGMDLKIGRGPAYNASIDRIDSSKGYEEGNIQWVDKTINFMKRTYSQELFINMCKKVAENNIT